MPHHSNKHGSRSRRSSKLEHIDPAVHEHEHPSGSDTEKMREEVEQKEEEEELNLENLSSADVTRLRHLSADDIKAMDEHISYAIDSFFENRIADCERTLRSHMATDPLAVTGAGLIAFIRCLLSMEQAQADVALSLLTKSSAMALQILNGGKGGISQSFSRAFSMRKKGKDQWLSPADFRAKTIHAESQALRCFVLVIQQSVSSVLKAGIALNKASGNYKALYTELEARYKDMYGSKAITLDATESPITSPNTFKEHDASLDKSAALDTLGVDRNSVHCAEFGLGAINLAVSLLPTNVRSMLRFIGVEGNRQFGLRLVRQCFMSESLLSPFASALLLGLYGFLPSISAFLMQSYVPVAHEVRQETLKRTKMQHSLLHLWLDGRIERLTRNVELSTAKLVNCLDEARNPQLLATMPQLRDFVVYDQWFNYAIMHQWKRASRCLEVLSKTSKWGNAIYQYSQAACLEMLESEWAEGIDNPEGEVDLELDELHRIVGTEQDKGRAITFCVLDTREDVCNTISHLYWEAAQRKPVTLGGKPNHNDQFVAKRMEEVLTCHDITVATYAGKKKLEDPLEPMPAGLRLRNIVPLPAYEMMLLVGLAHQIPAAQKDRMLARINKALLDEMVVRDTPLWDYVATIRTAASHQEHAEASSRASQSRSSRSVDASLLEVLPDNYRVLALCVAKALVMANSETRGERDAALEVIRAVRATPQLKDRQWTLSYAQAFVLYEQAYIAYQDESRDASDAILSALHKQYDSAHYFMHAKIDFKAHAASYELQEQKQLEKLKARGK